MSKIYRFLQKEYLNDFGSEDSQGWFKDWLDGTIRQTATNETFKPTAEEIILVASEVLDEERS